MHSLTKFNELTAHEVFTKKGRYDWIGFVIMPPGCGKSHYHTKIPGLIEADSVYDCRGNPFLHNLRNKARETGNWKEYDKAWANEIKLRLTGHLWVIMVPSMSVGIALGAQHLSCLTLDENVWNKNLEVRGKTSDDYQYALNDLGGGLRCPSNESLKEHLFTTAQTWMGLPLDSGN
jgi:hypothetical protein